MIINLRGTSGSGKSAIAHQLLKKYPFEPIPAAMKSTLFGSEPVGKPLGYQYDKARVVGSYTTVCGGCDGIATQDEVEQRVRAWHGEGYHVLFEGLLISGSYGRWHGVAKECAPFLFLFLDTPLEVCLERVRRRRRERGNNKPLNEKNTTNKWNGNQNVFKRAVGDSMEAEWVNSKQALQRIECEFGLQR